FYKGRFLYIVIYNNQLNISLKLTPLGERKQSILCNIAAEGLIFCPLFYKAKSGIKKAFFTKAGSRYGFILTF
uniref:hypothetical protein n=1 Tax=Candidatus Cardinium sp. cBcalN2 TaxID=2699436 RepID=UPI001FB333E7